MMTKFAYGYIDDKTGEMWRVAMKAKGSWYVMYRKRFGSKPDILSFGHPTKKSAMRKLMELKK